MEKIHLRFSFVLFNVLTIFILTSCGSSANSNAGDDNNQPGFPSEINGLITFDLYDSGASLGRVGIFILELNHGAIVKKRQLNGQYPYAYDRKHILFSKPCAGSSGHRIKAISAKGLESASYYTPCSNTIVKQRSYFNESDSPPFVLSKLSPDKTKVVVQVEWGLRKNTTYALLVFDANTQELIKRYDDYAYPDWLPDGRLLISPRGSETNSTGIYLTNSTFTRLSRIDKNSINQQIAYSDVSPSGNKVVFSVGAQVWVMNLDGTNLSEIIVDSSRAIYPTWSPDEQYIAYLSLGVGRYLGKINFLNLSSKKISILETDVILPDGLYTPMAPTGPLSWVK